jgi:hypothetical protein
MTRSIRAPSPGSGRGSPTNDRAGASRWAPTLGFLLGAPKPAQRFSQGLGRASLYTAPTAPLFATGEKLLRVANKVQAIAQGTLVDLTR